MRVYVVTSSQQSRLTRHYIHRLSSSDPKCSPMARFRKRTYADPTDIVRTVALGNYGGDIGAQSCGSTRQKIVFTICPYFNAFESIAYRTHKEGISWRAEQMSLHLPIYLAKGLERYLPSLLPLLPPSPICPILFPQARTLHCRGLRLTEPNLDGSHCTDGGWCARSVRVAGFFQSA